MFGIAPQYDTVFFKGVRLRDGRWLERGDTYKTVLGANVAADKKVGVGDTIIWLKKKLTVVGVMESTQTFPDNFAVVPFETARRVQRIPLWVSWQHHRHPGESGDHRRGGRADHQAGA